MGLAWRIVFVIFIVLTSFQAHASEPKDFTRWYKVHWGGLHIADLVASKQGNRLTTKIETYGLVKKVSRYANHAYVDYEERNGRVVPRLFDQKMQQRQRKRYVSIEYDKDGIITKDQVTPPDNRAKRPAVPQEQKAGAPDPITASLMAWQYVKAWQQGEGPDRFTLSYYDGRRLAKLDFHIQRRLVREINKRNYKVILVTFRRSPVSGFTNNELERMEGEEPDFNVYFSDDEIMLPLITFAKAPLGHASIVYERECKAIENCLEGTLTPFPATLR
jgi:hypothetical protein